MDEIEKAKQAWSKKALDVAINSSHLSSSYKKGIEDFQSSLISALEKEIEDLKHRNVNLREDNEDEEIYLNNARQRAFDKAISLVKTTLPKNI